MVSGLQMFWKNLNPYTIAVFFFSLLLTFTVRKTFEFCPSIWKFLFLKLKLFFRINLPHVHFTHLSNIIAYFSNPHSIVLPIISLKFKLLALFLHTRSVNIFISHALPHFCYKWGDYTHFSVTIFKTCVVPVHIIFIKIIRQLHLFENTFWCKCLLSIMENKRPPSGLSLFLLTNLRITKILQSQNHTIILRSR